MALKSLYSRYSHIHQSSCWSDLLVANVATPLLVNEIIAPSVHHYISIDNSLGDMLGRKDDVYSSTKVFIY